MKGLDGTPEVNELLKTEEDEINFGGSWHSDTAYKARPDMGTLLYALEVPNAGGDTLFANMLRAYEALSDGMTEMLDELVAVFSSEKGYGGNRAETILKPTVRDRGPHGVPSRYERRHHR